MRLTRIGEDGVCVAAGNPCARADVVRITTGAENRNAIVLLRLMAALICGGSFSEDTALIPMTPNSGRADTPVPTFDRQ
jgi:hypothetical protein